jgi:hypothetical protein
MYEQDFQIATTAFKDGNLAASEIVCRVILDADPGHAKALNLLGVIAARVGAREQAATYLADALARDPASRTVQRNLDAVRATAPLAAPAGERFLLVKAWGFGFWSDATHVLGAMLLAEITGRIPAIHWGRNSLFGDASGGDAFRLYFEPVSSVTLQDLARLPGAGFFPGKWNSGNLGLEDVARWQGQGSRAAALYFLNRPETVIVSDFHFGVHDVAPWLPAAHPLHGKSLAEITRYLVAKYLRPHRRVLEAVDAFFQARLQGAPFAAIHLRGSDKIIEDPSLQAAQDILLAEAALLDPAWRLFLLTDDEGLLARMTARYGDRVVFTDCQRTASDTGVHYLPNIDRSRAGMEVLTDTLLALRANRFAGNGRSNVSGMIALMKDWSPGDCMLIGKNILEERNLYLYMHK